MRKIIALLAVCLTAVMLLTGCGCMGCGGSDYADDGVVDGSTGTNSTDNVVGGDKNNTADDTLDGANELMDGARNAMDDIFGGNVSGNTADGAYGNTPNGNGNGSHGMNGGNGGSGSSGMSGGNGTN